MDQKQRAEAFAKLHTDEGMFVLPNPWDIGSAKMLAEMGYKALATTSAGFAESSGLKDYQVTREMKLAHIRALSGATELPLAADLENGFGDAPETCAETIKLGAEAGLVGGSIEDYSGNANAPIYELSEAVDRIRAAVEAANNLDFPFTLTARAENFLHNKPDLSDTITRLQAFQEAGAHVLYAPGLKSLADIKSVLASIDCPLNVLLGPFDGFVPLSDLADIGVKRVSMGSAFSNAAYSALRAAAGEVLNDGTLGFMAG